MKPPAQPEPRPLDLSQVLHHARTVKDRLAPLIIGCGNERLRARWAEWEAALLDICRRANERPEVAISFIGGVGSGKSTLINALLGVSILPVSLNRACTSAVCEVSYSDSGYSAEVRFISRAAWEREAQMLLKAYRQAIDSSPIDSSDGSAEIARSVTDKLRVVYAQSSGEAFDPTVLEEPDEIREALDRGVKEWTCSDIDQFAEQIAKFLDSQHRYWPIVETVSIRGRFEALRDGVKLIDLPGLNDPNEAREAVTKQHLKTCRFVWLLFNIKRAVTRECFEVLRSTEFRRQIVMDGRADSLTLVATATDDLSRAQAVKQYSLPKDTTTADAIAERNRRTRIEIRSQLDDLVADLRSKAGEDYERCATIGDHLRSSEIFTVSAQEYLRLRDILDDDPAGLHSEEETGVPALINHMRQISQAHGVKSHEETLLRQLRNLVSEIKAEVQAQQSSLKNAAEISETGQQELRAAIDAARKFLEDHLARARDQFKHELEICQKLLSERVKVAATRALGDLERLLERWGLMNVHTLGAICRRGGAHTDSKGHRHDFPADLAGPILDGIAFVWSDFFGERLRQALETGTMRLNTGADLHRDQLNSAVRRSSQLPPKMAEQHDAIFATLERVLKERMAQANQKMQSRIEHDRRNAYEGVTRQIRANLRPAFDRAAGESGTGMKARILAIVCKHTRDISRVLFDEAREALLEGVRPLIDWLDREYQTMIDALRRNAQTAADSLLTGDERIRLDELRARRQALSDLMNQFVRVTKDIVP